MTLPQTQLVLTILKQSDRLGIECFVTFSFSYDTPATKAIDSFYYLPNPPAQFRI